MARAGGSSIPGRRTAPREQRRQQLIKATIRSVAKCGLSETTTATVAKEAKLSQGTINLHFQSKERLLLETLRYLAEEYKNAWQKACDLAGPGPVEKLTALVKLDFDRKICQRNKLAVWFAFWGESSARPTYRKICAELDKEYSAMLNDLCTQLIKAGGYEGVDATSVVDGLTAICEGLWLDILLRPESIDREHGTRICMLFLAGIFPGHFKA